MNVESNKRHSLLIHDENNQSLNIKPRFSEYMHHSYSVVDFNQPELLPQLDNSQIIDEIEEDLSEDGVDLSERHFETKQIKKLVTMKK